MKNVKVLMTTLLALVVGMTAPGAADDDDEAEVAELTVLIESYNHFFNEQLRLNAQQQLIDAENRRLLLVGDRAQRKLKEGTDATTRSDGYCDPATLCRIDCNTANTLCMGNAARIASNCRDTANAHFDRCASQLLNNHIRCNPSAAAQCLNCCSMNPLSDCDSVYDDVDLDSELPDLP